MENHENGPECLWNPWVWEDAVLSRGMRKDQSAGEAGPQNAPQRGPPRGSQHFLGLPAECRPRRPGGEGRRDSKETAPLMSCKVPLDRILFPPYSFLGWPLQMGLFWAESQNVRLGSRRGTWALVLSGPARLPGAENSVQFHGQNPKGGS